MEVHIHQILANIDYAVGINVCISVTELVVFFNDAFLVLLVVLSHKFLSLEEAFEAFLVGLFQQSAREESSVELLGGKVVIARNVDFTDSHFFFLVDIDIDNDLVGQGRVVVLHNVHIGILETFLVKVSLNDDFCLIYDVGSQLVAFHDAHPFHQGIVVRLLHTIDVDLRHARAHTKGDFQIDLFVHDAVCLNLHRREKSLFPISFNRICNFIARQ